MAEQATKRPWTGLMIRQDDPLDTEPLDALCAWCTGVQTAKPGEERVSHKICARHYRELMEEA